MTLHRLRAAWARVQEPRVEKVVTFVVYVGVAILSVLTLTNPPMTISEPLGPVLIYLWVGLWLVGAVGGALVVFIGWWRAERLALTVGLIGIGVYTSVIVMLHITAPGSRFAQLTALWIAAGFYVLRLVRIWGPDFEPRT